MIASTAWGKIMNFANLKISARLGLAFGLVVALLLTVVAIAMSGMASAEQRLSNIIDDRYYKIDLTNSVKYNVASIHKHMRNHHDHRRRLAAS